MTVSSKVRIYDLAKELKLDTKRLIEEVRREGVDVSVPSNSVSKELAEKIRNKYFPKKETAVKRAVKVVKRAVAPAAEAAVAEAEPEVYEPEPVEVAPPEAEPGETPSAAPPVAPSPSAPVVPPAAKQPIPARLVKKLTPATRAEAPAPEVIEAPIVEPQPVPVEPPVMQEPPAVAPIEVTTAAPTNGVEVKTPPAPAPVPPP
ncbi:MAG TPA: translation initiation factor IF-2 N-terminal domain-containing protein, partial [Pyrinomonadaceae bacterium]|nr:translation initiation factor IF-2 N-terminal domain-containing protein [Pyrinomonadaceae bacterium]